MFNEQSIKDYIADDMLGIVRVNGQYSGQSLWPVEQMFIGDVYSIRISQVNLLEITVLQVL